MKAIVYHQYGSPDILKLEDIEIPAPKENEVLIGVHAASLNAADWHLMRGKPRVARVVLGILKPKYRILGADAAGRVEAVGKNAKQFKPGDEVFCDLSTCGFGTFAEYVCVRENILSHKPANFSFEEAAAVPLAAITALQGLRDIGQIQSGKKVLINGATGGVGTFALQLAKAFGAEVTAVCSKSKIDLVRSMGADHIIDYTKENFTQNGKRYDLILAANGYHPLSAYKRVLSAKGIYVMAGGTNAQMFQSLALGPFMSSKHGKKMLTVSATATQNDLIFLKDLAESGKIKPVIDKRYPLSEVSAAMRYLEEGHARGKIVINVCEE